MIHGKDSQMLGSNRALLPTREMDDEPIRVVSSRLDDLHDLSSPQTVHFYRGQRVPMQWADERPVGPEVRQFASAFAAAKHGSFLGSFHNGATDGDLVGCPRCASPRSFGSRFHVAISS